MTNQSLSTKDKIPAEYLKSQGERAELIEKNIVTWRSMFIALTRRSKQRYNRSDSMVKYDPIQGIGLVLNQLSEEDGCTQAELSRTLSITPQTLGPQIKRLEDEGLIFREKSPADKRVLLVFLTEKGRQAAEALQKEERFSGSMFEIFTIEELEQLQRLIAKLGNRLEEEYQAALSYDTLTGTKRESIDPLQPKASDERTSDDE